MVHWFFFTILSPCSCWFCLILKRLLEDESCFCLFRSSYYFELGFAKKLIYPHRDLGWKRWMDLIWFSIASVLFFKIFSSSFCQKRWHIEVFFEYILLDLLNSVHFDTFLEHTIFLIPFCFSGSIFFSRKHYRCVKFCPKWYY